MTSTTHSDFDKSTEALVVAAAFPQLIKDRTALITGVNKLGIGYTTAEALVSQAPRCLILAGRSTAKIQECVDSLHAQHPAIDIRPLIVDLSSQKSVKAAAAEVLSWTDVPTVDLVINNAGMMVHAENPQMNATINDDGIEMMFATNHLGHFLLTNLLMPKILASAETSPRGTTRIINLSSSGTFVSGLRASDINFQKPTTELPAKERPNITMMNQAGLNVNENMAYIPTAAYGMSKTCAVLFSVQLNHLLFEKHGILSLGVNPGEIRTELGRHTDREWFEKVIKQREEMGIMHWKSQGAGASTTLVAATDPALTLPGGDGMGAYLSDCQIAKGPVHATDEDDAKKLWEISEGLTGKNFEW